MDLSHLLEVYERRRAEAAEVGSRAPVAKVYELVLEELRQVDGVPDQGRKVGTGLAAEILGVSPKTIRRKCREGVFPGATKTSEAGEWRISLREIYQENGAGPGPETSSPRLWSPDE